MDKYRSDDGGDWLETDASQLYVDRGLDNTKKLIEKDEIRINTLLKVDNISVTRVLPKHNQTIYYLSAFDRRKWADIETKIKRRIGQRFILCEEESYTPCTDDSYTQQDTYQRVPIIIRMPSPRPPRSCVLSICYATTGVMFILTFSWIISMLI